MRLSDFRALSFDCYGTLIDWETGLWTALRPLAERAGVAREPALEAFAAAESQQERATPALKYPAVLAAVHAQLARAWNVATDAAEGARLGDSVGDWPAFSDTAEALRALQQHYKLVILSNVDRASFARSLPRLGVTFDAVCTAEDIGSYKPDPRNFAYLSDKIATIGVTPAELLHTAQSLFHDHAPANAAGLASAWIDRRAGQAGAGATAAPPAGVRYDFRFTSLAEMAAARLAERE